MAGYLAHDLSFRRVSSRPHNAVLDSAMQCEESLRALDNNK